MVVIVAEEPSDDPLNPIFEQVEVRTDEEVRSHSDVTPDLYQKGKGERGGENGTNNKGYFRSKVARIFLQRNSSNKIISKSQLHHQQQESSLAQSKTSKVVSTTTTELKKDTNEKNDKCKKKKTKKQSHSSHLSQLNDSLHVMLGRAARGNKGKEYCSNGQYKSNEYVPRAEHPMLRRGTINALVLVENQSTGVTVADNGVDNTMETHCNGIEMGEHGNVSGGGGAELASRPSMAPPGIKRISIITAVE